MKLRRISFFKEAHRDFDIEDFRTTKAYMCSDIIILFLMFPVAYIAAQLTSSVRVFAVSMVIAVLVLVIVVYFITSYLGLCELYEREEKKND